MKKIREIHNLLKDKTYTEKIKIYFSTKSAGDDYDPYEQNYTLTNLNPKVIRGLVRFISPEALVWKQYGLQEMGAIEIITEKRYKSWFENCAKVEYADDTYTVMKENTGNRVLIQPRANDTIRVILRKR
jgi:hypothetical protein